jgi:hypothetical protein
MDEMDEYNHKVRLLIDEQTIDQNIQFALSCLKRLDFLSKLLVNSDVENIVENINNLSETTDDIDKYLKILKPLLLHDDVEREMEAELMNYYILLITQILEYIKTKDNKYIYTCSDAILNIIRTTVANEYYKENEDEMELYCYFDMALEPEINHQKKIIEIIKTGNEQQLAGYINKNKIERKEIIKILYDDI